MKLLDLYTRVTETTGLEVLTVEAINTAIANCFADLTSRGYRDFEEVTITSDLITNLGYNMVSFDMPANVRSIIYCRVYFELDGSKAERIPLNHPYLESLVYEGNFRSNLLRMGKKSIFYIKNNKVYVEWLSQKFPVKIVIGVNKKITPPVLAQTVLSTTEDLSTIDINIRKEFEDALVLYACYFFYARELKDNELKQFHLNQYKYYVEDILHELANEDNYDEEDVVVVE